MPSSQPQSGRPGDSTAVKSFQWANQEPVSILFLIVVGFVALLSGGLFVFLMGSRKRDD